MNKTPKVVDNPSMLKEWNYKKNDALGLYPEDFSIGSGVKVWWICPKKHEYEATINLRKRGSGCAYCTNKKALKGFNDFESMHSDIAKQWHPTKNNGLLPSQVTYGSGKKVWWLCENGHSYKMCPRDRGRGGSCPKCSGVYKTSFPEQAVFYYIKQAFPDAINSYRDIFKSPMELDIYIPSLKVGIEYDGRQYHSSTKNQLKDAKKYEICKQNGISLIRIREWKKFSPITMSDHNIDIPDASDKHLNWAINKLCYHLGKIVMPDVDKDRNKIREYLTKKRNISLLSEYPEIAAEWDYEENYPLRPENFLPHSNEKVFWKCKTCGHKWKVAISSRTSNPTTWCPKCAGKKAGEKQVKNNIESKGSLYDLYPELMEEWDYGTNSIDPKKVTPASKEKANWICKKCGYHWIAPINKRTLRGHGCLLCSNQVVARGINDLETLDPELAKEWNYKRNELKPYEVALKSNKKIWWTCSVCGHEWIQSPSNRSKGHGCPCCSGRVPKIGINDFKTRYPELADDWDYVMNQKHPEEFLPGSHSLAFWICNKCGYHYKKTIYNKVRNPKCPNCYE